MFSTSGTKSRTFLLSWMLRARALNDHTRVDHAIRWVPLLTYLVCSSLTGQPHFLKYQRPVIATNIGSPTAFSVSGASLIYKFCVLSHIYSYSYSAGVIDTVLIQHSQ